MEKSKKKKKNPMFSEQDLGIHKLHCIRRSVSFSLSRQKPRKCLSKRGSTQVAGLNHNFETLLTNR